MSREQAVVDLPVKPGELLLGKYRIGEQLGAGGMGVVVAAEHVQLGQKVAVKFLPATLRENPMAVARFAREARAAAQIRSEHVVRVVDVSGADSDICYMVMEYLEGSDLAQVLRTRGPVSPGEAVGYVLQACEAIAEAHGSGIVHRDLKPGNLFLTRRRDGSPLIKVLDFGISKVTAAGDGQSSDLTSTMTLMGSPMYMSPEQVRSTKNVDSRTDIWSLGVILHELVTGQPVYQADSAMGLLAMIAADPPTPIRQVRPELPAALEAPILACLEKNPQQRLPDVGALARRLKPLAPRWAALSVDRIMATSLPPPSAVVDADERPSGTTQSLPPSGSTTSAQLAGELLPVQGGRRASARPLAADVTTAKVTDASVAASRGRGRFVAVGVGAAAAIVVAVLMLGKTSPSPPALPTEGPRPTEQAGASAIRAVEKQELAPAAHPTPAPLPDTPAVAPVPPSAPAPSSVPAPSSAPAVEPPAVAAPVHEKLVARPHAPKHADSALPSSHAVKSPAKSPPSAAPEAGKDPLDGRR